MVSETVSENLALYPPHQVGEEAEIRLVDMRRSGVRIYGVSPPLARAIGRLSRPRPFRAALWVSLPLAMVSALVLAGSPAEAAAFPMPTGSSQSQPHMSEHVYELDGKCLRAVPKDSSAPASINASTMSDFMSELPGRSEWTVSTVSCATYRSKHEAGAWGNTVYEQLSGANSGIIYYPW